MQINRQRQLGSCLSGRSREDRRTYRALLRQLRKFEFTMTGDSDGVISDAYGVSGIPHMLMIGKDGIVGHVYRGYSEESLPGIVADLNALLAEPDPEPVAAR